MSTCVSLIVCMSCHKYHFCKEPQKLFNS